MRIFFKVSVMFLKFPFYSLAFNVHSFRKGKALLITAACGDVVELVKSIYVQLSLIWSAGHPLHQAISLFSALFCFFTKNKRKTQEKEAEQKKKKTEEKDFKKGGKAFFQKQNR